MCKGPMMKVEIFDEELGDAVEVTIPAKRAVCSQCDGEGMVGDGRAYTGDEWRNMAHDDRESYLRGEWDIICPTCKGERLVLIPHPTLTPKHVLEALEEMRQIEAEIAAEEAHERRMLGGW